jgi:hypothetical protein
LEEAAGKPRFYKNYVRRREQLVLKWVEGSDIKLHKIPLISGRHNQTVDPRGRRDHGIL